MKKTMVKVAVMIISAVVLFPSSVMALSVFPDGAEIPVTVFLEESTIRAHAGDSGKLKLADIGDLQVEGKFKPWSNDYFELREDGSWRAWGEFEFKLPVTASYTEESFKRAQEMYPQYVMLNEEKDLDVSVTITYKSSLERLFYEVLMGLKRDAKYLTELFSHK